MKVYIKNYDFENTTTTSNETQFTESEENSLYSDTSDFNSVNDYPQMDFRFEDIYKIVLDVRKIVKIFKNSSIKNNKLQECVVSKKGKRLNLILDSKTRWSSMEAMLNRFLEVEIEIRKTLIDLRIGIEMTDSDIEILKSFVKIIRPLSIATSKLNERSSNLLTAE